MKKFAIITILLSMYNTVYAINKGTNSTIELAARHLATNTEHQNKIPDTIKESRDKNDLEQKIPYRYYKKKQYFSFRIKLWIENITPSSTINGGNYLYFEAGYIFYKNCSINIKYSTSLVPDMFDDKLLSISTIVPFNGIGNYFAPFYMKNYINQDNPYQYCGIRTPLFSTINDDGNTNIEILPLSIIYNIEKKDFSFSYEIISVSLRF